ncbi:hypothetical protein [Sphingomonas oryzagri]
MQHNLQLRAAARAHFTYAHPLGPMRFEDAEKKRTSAYLKAVEAALEETVEIEALLERHRQGSLFEDMMGMTPDAWDALDEGATHERLSSI